MINLSARNYQLTIAGLDCTPALTSAGGNFSHYDQSGLSLVSATFTLGRGIAESFNHRTNGRWARGNKIDVTIANNAGSLGRAPIIGWLYVLNATPNARLTELTIEAGCILNLLNFRTPAGDGACVDLGATTELNTIAATLLQKAGCPLPFVGTIAGQSLTRSLPKLTNESYIQLLGKLAWSNGCICYQTNDGKIAAKPISLFPAALMRKQVATHAVTYEFLDGAESPCEKVVCTGTLKKYKAPEDTKSDYSEDFAPLLTVDPEAPGGTREILVEKLWRDETINRGSRTKEVITKRLNPLGSLMPEIYPRKTQLGVAERLEETYYYEKAPNTNPGADNCDIPDEGRLTKTLAKSYQPWGVALREFETTKKEVEGGSYVAPPWTALVLAKEVTTEYKYNDLPPSNPAPGSITIASNSSQPILEIVTRTRQSIGTTFPDLGDPDADGDGEQLITSNPTALADFEQERKDWVQRRKQPDEWQLTEKSYKLYGVAYPDNIEKLREEGVAQIQSLREALIQVERQVGISNSGQNTPPSPERFTPEQELEIEQQIKEPAYFPPVHGSVFREREREFSIDSEMLTSAAQAQAVAKIEGAMLYGRWKGQSCTIDLAAEMFNFSPLSRCDWTEVDGTANAFLMDGCAIAMAVNRVAISFDGIWMGAVASTPVLDPITGNPVLDPITGDPLVSEAVNPPYTPTTELKWGFGLGLNLQWFPYELDTGSTTLQWGMGMGWMLTTETIPMTTLEWGMGMGFKTEDGGILQDESGDFLLDENGELLLEG